MTELRITQDILEFTVELYRVTQALPREEMYGLQSQMRRAAVSIGSNVVEGSRRGSDRDFSRFLAIAEASAAELAYQLRLTADLEMISSETFDRVSGELESIRRRVRAGQDPQPLMTVAQEEARRRAPTSGNAAI